MLMGLAYISEVEPENFLMHWLHGVKERKQVGWPLVQETN